MDEFVFNKYNPKEMLADWWLGLQFLIHRSFYQARRDSVSKRVEEVTMQVLNIHNIGISTHKIDSLKNNGYLELEKDLKGVIGKGKIGKERDIKMIISILKYLS